MPTIRGSTGDDNSILGAFDDRIDGREGNDQIDLRAGDDLAVGGAGRDILIGGDGLDTLYGASRLADGTNESQPLGYSPLDDDDILRGGSGDDFLYGEDGNDVIYGGFSSGLEEFGFDFLSGGVGDDVLYDPVEDRFRGRDYDEMVGGASNADLVMPERDVALIHKPVGAQVRWKYESPTLESGGFNLRDGSFWIGRRAVVETFVPGDRPDPNAEPEPDVILDRLHLYGVEYLRIYDDVAQLNADAGRLWSDPTSRVEILDPKNLVPLIGFTQFDDVYPDPQQFPAGAGLDSIVYDPTLANNLDGLEGNDSIVAGVKDDTVSGGAGDDPDLGKNDTLLGGPGDDWLFGHLGNDWLYGEANDDRIEGGVGIDLLSGGSGNDDLGAEPQTVLQRDVFGGGGGDDTIWSASGRIESGAAILNESIKFSEAPVLIGGQGRDNFTVIGSSTTVTFDPTMMFVADLTFKDSPEEISADDASQRFIVRGHVAIDRLDQHDSLYVERAPNSTYLIGRDEKDEMKWWLHQFKIEYLGEPQKQRAYASLSSSISFFAEEGTAPVLVKSGGLRESLEIYRMDIAALDSSESKAPAHIADGQLYRIALSSDAFGNQDLNKYNINEKRILQAIQNYILEEDRLASIYDFISKKSGDEIRGVLIEAAIKSTKGKFKEILIDLFGDLNVAVKAVSFVVDTSFALREFFEVILRDPPAGVSERQNAALDLAKAFVQAGVDAAVPKSTSLAFDLGVELYEVLAIKIIEETEIILDNSVQQIISNENDFDLNIPGSNNIIDFRGGLLDRIYLPGGGNDTVFDGFGNSYFKAGLGSGDDLYDGGAGQDLADFGSASSASPLLVDLSAERAASVETGEDTLIDIEDVAGGAGNDTIRGNAAANELVGEGGDDSISGGAGEDVLVGGAGQDTFWGSLSDLDGDFIADLESGETIFILGEALSEASARLEGGSRLVIDRDGDGRPEATIQLAGTFRFASPNLAFEQAALGTAISIGSRFADVFTLSEDAALPATAANNLLANDDITGNGPTRLELIAQAAHGTVTLADDGTFTYTPDVDFFGTDTFVYRWSNDTDAGPATTVALRVGAENDAPTVIADSVTTPRDVPVLIAPDTLLANDGDIDSDYLAITGVGQAVNGSVVLEGGIITFTPDAGFRGEASFNYTVYDGDLSSQGTVTVTVTDPVPRTIFTSNGKLWVTDGTPEGTAAISTPPLEFFRSLETFRFTALGDGRVVFAANGGGSGFEPWVTDGTTEGTYVLKDIISGGGSSLPYAFASLPDGRVIFSAISTVVNPNGENEQDIWVTDGTASGTVLLSDAFVGARNFTVLDNQTVLFSAWTTYSSQSSIYKLDLSTNAIEVVAGSSLVGSLDPHSFIRIADGKIVFFDDGLGGAWITDGTTAGTAQMPIPVAFDDPGSEAGSPVIAPLGDGRLVFRSGFDNALWVTDGTTPGTFRLQPQGQGASYYMVPFGDGRVAFTTSDGDLAVTDGTVNGTFRIDMGPGPSTLGPYVPLSDGRIVFPATAYANTVGQELYISDGTVDGTYLVKDVWPGYAGGLTPNGYPFNWTEAGQTGDGRALFPASAGTAGTYGTWITDGTADGTFLLSSVATNARYFGLLRSGDDIDDVVGADADGPYFVTMGGTLSVRAADGLLTGDRAPGGRTLTAEIVSGTTNGSIELRADGGFLYTPIPGFVGVDSFVYRARTDADEVSKDVVIQIGITSLPSAREGTPVLRLAEDSAATSMELVLPFFGQDELTITVLRVPLASRGQILQSDGITPVKVGDVLTEQALETLLFRPAPNACGPAGIFRYKVSDGEEVRIQQISIELTNVVDTLIGTSGADELTGTHCGDRIEGLAGDDVLLGFGGTDTIIGGDGDDLLGGLVGNADDMTGGEGNDVYLVGDAADIIREEPDGGNDTVRTRLTAFTLGTDLENLTFFVTVGDAVGEGNDANNRLWGGDGNDELRALGGDDTLNGRGGADTMIGGEGDDRYIVSEATDIIQEFEGEGFDVVRSYANSYTLSGDVERLVYIGNQGNFIGIGNASDNDIVGGSGNDSIRGEAGNDVLIGGRGADTVVGGAGDDQYRFLRTEDSAPASPDLIVDFTFDAGGERDRVNLRPIDANLGAEGDQAFAYIGTAEFTGVAGQLRVQTEDAIRHLVSGDVNGDGAPDFAVVLQSQSAPSAAWFIL